MIAVKAPLSLKLPGVGDSEYSGQVEAKTDLTLSPASRCTGNKGLFVHTGSI